MFGNLFFGSVKKDIIFEGFFNFFEQAHQKEPQERVDRRATRSRQQNLGGNMWSQ